MISTEIFPSGEEIVWFLFAAFAVAQQNRLQIANVRV
jgi:hypothetical protein